MSSVLPLFLPAWSASLVLPSLPCTGIALPEKKPLYAAMAGGAIAGASAMLMGVVTYAFSMPGITSIATYVDGGNNFFKLLIVMAIAWISGFVISFVMNKKEQ